MARRTSSHNDEAGIAFTPEPQGAAGPEPGGFEPPDKAADLPQF